MACPICGKPAEKRFRPFCSARCADVDLAHWLRGDYRIPAFEGEDEAEGTTPQDSDNLDMDSRDQAG